MTMVEDRVETDEEDLVRAVTVYGLIDPSDGALRYIGQTERSLDRRLFEHVWDSTYEDDEGLARDTHKARWIRKVLRSGAQPIIEVLDVVPADEANGVERAWIVHYRAHAVDGGPRLTNATGGGRGAFDPSPEMRARMSASARNARAKGLSAAQLAGLEAGRRGRFGPQACAKLTDSTAVEIREKRFRGTTFAALAAEYGIAVRTLQQLVAGETWRHVGGPITAPRAPLTDDQVREIRRASSGGEVTKSIASRYGVRVQYIQKIIAGSIRANVLDPKE